MCVLNFSLLKITFPHFQIFLFSFLSFFTKKVNLIHPHKQTNQTGRGRGEKNVHDKDNIATVNIYAVARRP